MELAARLDRDRYETHIISGHTVEPVYDLEAYSERTGIPITILPRLRRDISLMDDMAACRDLTRLLKQSQPDIVHTHTSKAGILGRIAAKIAGTSVVVHAPHGHIFHGYFDRITSRFFILLEKLMARGTDRIITLTDLGKRDHIAYGIAPENRFATIPCAIDLSRFKGAKQSGLILREKLGLKAQQPLVLWVGRLVPIKGCEQFIEACALVAESEPDARFFMVGDGEVRDKLRGLATSLGLESRLEITGEWTDIVPWMGAADMFVLSSHNEGLGRVILEAMATQKPVVATDVGGVAEIVFDGETGYLVPPRSPQSLADGMLKLLHDPTKAKAMGQSGFKRAQSYDLQKMTEDTAMLYEDLLLEKGHPCAISH